MKRMRCLSLLISAMVFGRAGADYPVSPCFETPNRLALINDTAVLSQTQIELSRPEGPSVTYLLKMDADDMANSIMQRLARDKETQGGVMLSSHGNTLTVTGGLRAQKRVLEKIVGIENPRPLSQSSSSIVAVVREAHVIGRADP